MLLASQPPEPEAKAGAELAAAAALPIGWARTGQVRLSARIEFLFANECEAEPL